MKIKVAVITDNSKTVYKENIYNILDSLDKEDLELIIPNKNCLNTKHVLDWAKENGVHCTILTEVKPLCNYSQYTKIEAITAADIVLIAAKGATFSQQYAEARDKKIIYSL